MESNAIYRCSDGIEVDIFDPMLTEEFVRKDIRLDEGLFPAFWKLILQERKKCIEFNTRIKNGETRESILRTKYIEQD
jgi:hypothetical protein